MISLGSAARCAVFCLILATALVLPVCLPRSARAPFVAISPAWRKPDRVRQVLQGKPRTAHTLATRVIQLSWRPTPDLAALAERLRLNSSVVAARAVLSPASRRLPALLQETPS